MLSLIRSIAAVSALSAGVLVLGCHSPQEPKQPDVGLTRPVNSPQMPDLGRGASRAEMDEHYKIFLGEGIGDICSGPSPYFNTASANASKTGSAPTMQVLAHCMMDGPLKDKSIILIGHTDPRGSEDYNAKLGAKRADDVRRYLITQGVAADRVTTQTAGETTASGDPKDWPTDRRVEIQLNEKAKTAPVEPTR